MTRTDDFAQAAWMLAFGFTLKNIEITTYHDDSSLPQTKAEFVFSGKDWRALESVWRSQGGKVQRWDIGRLINALVSWRRKSYTLGGAS